MPSALTHATFCVERVYDAAPARVFHAFTDPAARLRWFFRVHDWTLHEHSGGELGVGKTESSRFSPPGADVVITNDSIYLDVAPNERLIFAYAVTLGAAPAVGRQEGTGGRGGRLGEEIARGWADCVACSTFVMARLVRATHEHPAGGRRHRFSDSL